MTEIRPLSPDLVRQAAQWAEADLRDHIMRTCKIRGLKVNYHKRPQFSPVKGWPDLQIIGPRGVLYRELKDMTGTLEVDQRKIGALLQKAGQDWAVWRPVDWFADVISRQLAAIMREKDGLSNSA